MQGRENECGSIFFLLCLRYSRECGDKSTCGGIVQDFVWEKSRDTETELRVVYPSPKIHSKFVRETEISLCNFRSVRK